MDFMSKADMLYQDVESYQIAIESAMAAEGATPSDIAAVMEFQKDNLKEGIEKCYKTRENYLNAAKKINAEIDILNQKIKELKGRAAGFEERATVLDNAVMTALQVMGEDRVFTPLVTVEVKASAERVVIDDDDLVPDELRNPPKPGTPSKTLIKKYLANNPDCEFAHIEREPEIKYKAD